MTTKDTLIRAKEILVEHGISRSGYYYDSAGCLCTLGAVYMACGATLDQLDGGAFFNWDDLDVDSFVQARTVLGRALNQIDPNEFSIPHYNDHLAGDEQVYDLFDKAIELAE